MALCAVLTLWGLILETMPGLNSTPLGFPTTTAIYKGNGVVSILLRPTRSTPSSFTEPGVFLGLRSNASSSPAFSPTMHLPLSGFFPRHGADSGGCVLSARPIDPRSCRVGSLIGFPSRGLLWRTLDSGPRTSPVSSG